jgi:HEAT repeat protein
MLNMLPAESIPLNTLVEALKSKNPAARFSSAQALARRGDREARMALQEILAIGEAPSRASAARHLYGFSWYTAEPLLRQALCDADSRVHESVMYALADFRNLNAYRLMAEALQNTSDNVREAAAYSLRDCQDPAALPVLILALQARDPEVRVKALEALSANNNPAGIPYVRAAVDDPVVFVSYAATLSWLELAGEACLDDLATFIETKRGKPREMLLRAFFHATNYLNIKVRRHERLIDVLEAVLDDKSPKVRMAAIWPLAWTRHERTPDILKRAYSQEENSEVKAHIVRVAASLMSAAGEDILQQALMCSEDEVRRAAESIIVERERTGITLTYDETAAEGKGLAKPMLGR